MQQSREDKTRPGDDQHGQAQQKSGQNGPNINIWVVLAAVLALLIGQDLYTRSITQNLTYDTFLSKLEKGEVKSVYVGQEVISGRFKEDADTQHARFMTPRVNSSLAKKLSDYQVEFKGQIQNEFLRNIMYWIMGALVFIGLWMLAMRYMMKQQQGGPGIGSLMQAGKSKSKIYVEEDTGVTFDDVAGVDEAKEEVQEVVDFLQNTSKYTRLGATIPRGMLLVGPPGTGKTLMARAIAGEASVPFFSISGSEFIEMFVGVGAARVRDLFEQAKQKAPAIIFIDELDTLGKARGPMSQGGGHGEQEQTLNQLLDEMDGFDPTSGIIVMAATNRPEILDPALLRSGRFDRRVVVDRPDKKGRGEILRLYMDKIEIDREVDADKVAGMTTGFTGADLSNLVNEAALQATRRRAEKVEMQDFEAAVERIVAGIKQESRVINDEEREIVAHHEMGHALVAMALPGTEPVQKISIVPRSVGALGFTMQRPTEDRYLMREEELKNRMAVMMGGRAAEREIFDQISTGASDDLARVTDTARAMVVNYGMHDKIGQVALEDPKGKYLSGNGDNSSPFGQQREYSDTTAEAVDSAVRELVDEAYERAREILRKNKKLLKDSAKTLLDEETLEENNLENIKDKIQVPQKAKKVA